MKYHQKRLTSIWVSAVFGVFMQKIERLLDVLIGCLIKWGFMLF